MIFAFSIHSFVDKIGAYAGFAAVIGLALFALLLFAQARELRRMREWGAHAHDRIGELERRLAAALELARRASTSQRTMPPAAAPRPAAARPAAAAPGRGPVAASTSAPTRLPLLPAAPVGVGGAALGSATVLVPLPKHPPAAPAPAPGAVPAALPAVAAAASAAVAATPPPAPAPPAPATAAAAQGVPQAPVPAPAPVVPSSTNGHSDTFPPVPPVRRPAPPARAAAGRRPPARGRAGAPPARAGARPAAAAPLRARSTPSATPRGGGGSADGTPRRRLLLLLIGGLGVVVVAVIAVLLLSGGGSSGTPSTQSASSTGATPQHTTASHKSTPAAAGPAHSRITVAVLNGTPTAGLANTIATTLTSAGFVKGPIGNASNQQRSVTVVSYFGGHEADAQEVAKTLGVSADAVQPIDSDTETACAQGATCTATVVVTVGADRQ